MFGAAGAVVLFGAVDAFGLFGAAFAERFAGLLVGSWLRWAFVARCSSDEAFVR
nr:hypothetical protein [Streptomyces noursei]